MSWTAILALTISFAAFAAWANHRFLRAPPTVALMSMALAVSLAVLAVERWTGFEVSGVLKVIRALDFSTVLLDGILPFLLFAAALHVDLRRLREERVPVVLLATVGVGLATVICGALVWWAALALGVPLTFVQALLFGALIAPTDPIAVIGILRRVKAPKSLDALISGESLLNDGVGVVLFVAFLGAAVHAKDLSVAELGRAIALEGAGGALFGAAIGWVACHMLSAVDDYPVEIFVTLATAFGTYTLANALHMSGPLAVVAAGLVITSFGRSYGMSETTQQHLDPFWEIVDEMLNAVLFMLVGLEAVVVAFDVSHMGLAVVAIAAVLIARWTSVGAVLLSLRGTHRFGRGTLGVLTWGGLRGGISIALVLSLPEGDLRSTLLTATYAVVLFTLLVQAPTLARVVRASIGPKDVK